MASAAHFFDVMGPVLMELLFAGGHDVPCELAGFRV